MSFNVRTYGNTTTIAGTPYNPTNIGSSAVSGMAGGNSSFTPRTYLSTTSSNTTWQRPDRLSTDAIANLYNRPTTNYQGLNDPWGVSDSPIIDDDERAGSSSGETSGIESATRDTDIAEEAVEGLTEGEAIASASTPWTLAAIVNQQLGEVTSKAMTTGLQNQSASDYAQNIQQHGLNVGLNAGIIQSQQENTIRNQELGGSIGSFFGPIGALIGHAVAGYASVNQDQLKTAGSFDGMVNPQQSGIVASQTTAGDQGQQTQVDNVDTTNV
jgi:hypothetical protein